MVETIEIFYVIILSLQLVTLVACAILRSDGGASYTLHSSGAVQTLCSWLLPTPVAQLPVTCNYESSTSSSEQSVDDLLFPHLDKILSL